MPQEVPATAEVAAVVTAFRPGPELVGLVRMLLPQVARVVIVDDEGASAPTSGVLEQARAAGALVVRHESNRGIAAALNTGIRAARADAVEEPRFVLTLDQDSWVDEGFVARLVTTALEAERAGLAVGLVSPAEVEGLPSPVTGHSRGFVLGGTPIQSGMLLPLAALERVGPFAEPLFIDGVDTDYALRLGAAGLAVLLSPGARLGHSLGSRHPLTLAGRPLRLGGEPVALVSSAPFRYYYLLRNRVLLNRMHGRRHRAWSVRETLGDLRHCAIVLVFVPDRLRRARAMRAGLRDGWAGRTGRIPPALEQRLR